MNYRHIYMKIILNAKKEQKLGKRPQKRSRTNIDGYYEFHHILPKSLFPLWTKRKSNIVPLTAREHFFCHQLLTKIYSNNNKMIFALYRMASGNNKSNRLIKYSITSREYERIRILNSNARKGIAPGNKGLHTGKPVWNKGLSYKDIYTEEELKKFAPKNIKKGKDSHRYGTHLSNETKEKLSAALKGRQAWNKGKSINQTRGANNGNAHSCILLNTGEVFETIAEAKKKYPMARHITECCQGKLKSAGTLNGEKLRWSYGN